MKTISKTGLKVKASLKAGALPAVNHSRARLKVRAGVTAGALPAVNHNRGGLKVKASVKAGSYIVSASNHSMRAISL